MLAARPELIVFDLDGTLVDSAPDLAYCADALLASLGRPPAGLAQVRGWIGNGIPMLVRRALTGELWPQQDPEGFDEALRQYKRLYGENVCHLSRLYPGVMEGLHALRAQGFRLACLTNKHSDFTMPLLEKLGIAALLDHVACGNQFSRSKPDPEPLLKTAGHFGLKASQCLMVGDSENDVKAARAAGYAIFCVPYGYHHCARVEDLGPDAVIGSIADLANFFKKAA